MARTALTTIRLTHGLLEAVQIDNTRKMSSNDALHSLTTDLWGHHWATSVTGSSTRSFFPDILSAKRLESLKLTGSVTQVITGHSYLNAHQFRFKFAASPTCHCGLAPETVHHFLFECATYDRERVTFLETSRRLNCSWSPNLFDIPKHPTLWGSMLNYIHQTKRLRLYLMTRFK